MAVPNWKVKAVVESGMVMDVEQSRRFLQVVKQLPLLPCHHSTVSRVPTGANPGQRGGGGITSLAAGHVSPTTRLIKPSLHRQVQFSTITQVTPPHTLINDLVLRDQPKQRCAVLAVAGAVIGRWDGD
jgi:hypothetical protein